MAKSTDPKRSEASRKAAATRKRNAEAKSRVTTTNTKETSNTEVRETSSWLVPLLLVLALLALAWLIFGPCKVCTPATMVAVAEAGSGESTVVEVSCVKRMQPGETADVFTETWDSERRVWVHLDKGTCSGPYCFTYDQCADPLATLKIQPFWTGHELSPVDSKPFDICYNFEGNCAR